MLAAGIPWRLRPSYLYLAVTPGLQVVQQTHHPAVLVAGWSDIDALIGPGDGQVSLPEQLLVVPQAPHDWLLPR